MPRSGYTLQPRALALGYAQREFALKVAAEVRFRLFASYSTQRRVPLSGQPLTNHLTQG